MINSPRRLKTVSTYVTRPVAKPSTHSAPAVVTQVVTAVVTKYVTVTQVATPTRAVTAVTTPTVQKIDVGADDTRSVLEKLMELAREYPKLRYELTGRSSVSREEARKEGDMFLKALPEGIQESVRRIGKKLYVDVGGILFYYYLTKCGKIVVSEKPISGTVIEGHLIEGHLGEFGVRPNNYERILKDLGVWSKYKKYFKDENEHDDETDKIRNEIASIPAYYYTEFNPGLGEVALRDWEEFVYEVIFRNTDPFIAAIYLPALVPANAFPFKATPNVILGAPTRTGKTTIASVIGYVFERITEASLHGGKFGDSVSAGIVHDFDGLVQIETLETQTLRTLVGGLLGLTSRGEATVGVYGTKIKTMFKGPVYITFNTQGGTQKTISSTVRNVAVAIAMNPEALAGRFALLASTRPRPLGDTPLIQAGVAEVVREAIRAVRWLTRKKVRGLITYSDWVRFVNEVRKEFRSVGIDASEVIFLDETLQVYFSTLLRTAPEHLARLGFCSAVAKHLPEIYDDRVTRDYILRKALEEAKTYGGLLNRTIIEVGKMIDDALQEAIEKLPRDKTRKFVYALVVALWNASLEKGIMRWADVKESMTVSIETLFNEFKNTRLYSEISANKFASMLKGREDPVLDYIGFQYLEEKRVVTFDANRLLHVVELLKLS